MTGKARPASSYATKTLSWNTERIVEFDTAILHRRSCPLRADGGTHGPTRWLEGCASPPSPDTSPGILRRSRSVSESGASGLTERAVKLREEKLSRLLDIQIREDQERGLRTLDIGSALTNVWDTVVVSPLLEMVNTFKRSNPSSTTTTNYEPSPLQEQGEEGAAVAHFLDDPEGSERDIPERRASPPRGAAETDPCTNGAVDTKTSSCGETPRCVSPTSEPNSWTSEASETKASTCGATPRGGAFDAVECPGCKASMLRKDAARHATETCPHRARGISGSHGVSPPVTGTVPPDPRVADDRVIDPELTPFEDLTNSGRRLFIM